MKIKISTMDSQTEYFLYMPDFVSAYKNNGNNIELALHQVSNFRNVEIEHLRTILKRIILILKTT